MNKVARARLLNASLHDVNIWIPQSIGFLADTIYETCLLIFSTFAM
jgi:hypothetical protein